MAKDEVQAPSVEEKKIGVIVDQDGVFIRLERDDVELEEGKDFDLYEEEVEKDEDEEEDDASDAGTPPAPTAELGEGDEVIFAPEVAKLFGSPNGVFIEAISTAEAKILVNEKEEVVGFDSFHKA